MEKILITEEEITQGVTQMGERLCADFQDKIPLMIGVLKGALPFMMDLVKRMEMKMEMDFIAISSYGGATVSSGEVKILKDLDTSVEGRDVIVVEDIIDTGLTLNYLVDLLKRRHAKSVSVVTLLDKPEGRKVDITPDYRCFLVPNEFVVGYGLDYDELYRNVPYVGVLKPSVYKK